MSSRHLIVHQHHVFFIVYHLIFWIIRDTRIFHEQNQSIKAIYSIKFSKKIWVKKYVYYQQKIFFKKKHIIISLWLSEKKMEVWNVQLHIFPNIENKYE